MLFQWFVEHCGVRGGWVLKGKGGRAADYCYGARSHAVTLRWVAGVDTGSSPIALDIKALTTWRRF